MPTPLHGVVMIDVCFLGPIDAHTSDGRDVSVIIRQPKLLAFFAFLAAPSTERFHRRDNLVAMFWPESDQARGRSSLRKALHRLRSALGEDCLRRRGTEEVAVDRERVRCDTHRFEAAVDGGDWDRATDLYAGAFLDGLYISGAPKFEHWLDRERNRYRSRAAEAAWGVAHTSRKEGELRGAARWADAAASYSPGDEIAARRVIRFFAEIGDRAGAMSRYERFAEYLHAEFDATPSAETDALIQAVRTGNEFPEMTTASPESSAPSLSDGRRRPPRLSRVRTAVAVAAISLVLTSGSGAGAPSSEPAGTIRLSGSVAWR